MTRKTLEKGKALINQIDKMNELKVYFESDIFHLPCNFKKDSIPDESLNRLMFVYELGKKKLIREIDQEIKSLEITFSNLK